MQLLLQPIWLLWCHVVHVKHVECKVAIPYHNRTEEHITAERKSSSKIMKDYKRQYCVLMTRKVHQENRVILIFLHCILKTRVHSLTRLFYAFPWAWCHQLLGQAWSCNARSPDSFSTGTHGRSSDPRRTQPARTHQCTHLPFLETRMKRG